MPTVGEFTIRWVYRGEQYQISTTDEDAAMCLTGLLNHEAKLEAGVRFEAPLPLDNVNHPPHYLKHPSGVECITITEHFNFNVGNAIKYLWRSSHKNGLEDMKKARWYIDREISRLDSRRSQ